MASRFWVAGGSPTWNNATTTPWAATSGGAGGASCPTAADDVFLDANSGAGSVTLGTGATCRSLDCTGFTGTLVHTAGVTLTIGDATAGAGNNALKLVAGMTYTLGSNTTSAISFLSTSATQQTIDFAGKINGNLTWNGAGGSWILSNNLPGTAGNTDYTLTAGSLNTNGKSITGRHFFGSNSNTRSLTLGASVITLSTNGGGSIWDFGTVTGLTFSAGTSSIVVSGTNTSFSNGGLTYNDVSITGSGGGGISLGAAGSTFHNLTVVASSSTEVQLLGCTVSNALSFSPSGVNVSGVIRSAGTGTAAVITAASATIGDVMLMDITIAGVAAPVTATNTGDMGGNSGVTFPAAVTRYWTGGAGGSWSDITKWSASSGGAGGASRPLPQDTAVFDANSITSAGQTIGMDRAALPTIDYSGVLNSPTIAQGIVNSTQYLIGSYILKAGLTVTGTPTVRFSGRGSFTLDTKGITIPSALNLDAPGGTYTFASALVTTAGFSINNGTWATAGFGFTAVTLVGSNSGTKVWNFGSSTVTVTGTGPGNVINLAQGGTTVIASNATIVISVASSSSRSITTNGESIGTLTYTVAGSTGDLKIVGANTFGTINFSDATNARTLTFPASTTNIITTNFNLNGSTATTVNSSSAGTKATIIIKGSWTFTNVTWTDITKQFWQTTAAVGSALATLGRTIAKTLATWGVAANAPGLKLDGVADYASVAHNALLAASGGVTIGAFARFYSAAGSQAMASKTTNNSGYAIENRNGLAKLEIGNGATTQSSPGFTPTLGVRHRMIGTFDGTNIRLYVDGNLIGTTVVSATTISDNGGSLQIGRYSGALADLANMIVDGAFMMNRAMTGGEVTTDYAAPNGSLPTDGSVKLNLLLNDGSGSTAADTSGNGLNGTVTGGRWIAQGVSLAKMLPKTLSVSGTGAVSMVRMVAKSLTKAATAAVTLTTLSLRFRTLAAAGTATATMQRMVAKTISKAATATVSIVKMISRTLTYSAAAVVSLTLRMTLARTIAAAGSVTVSLVRQGQYFRTLAATGSFLATILRVGIRIATGRPTILRSKRNVTPLR